MKFTAKSIAALKPREKEYTERDSDGFAIRVYPTGRMSWLFIYDIAKRRRKMTLAHYPETSLADARKMHTKARSALDQGSDPAAQKRERARKLQLELRVKDLVAEYLDTPRFKKRADSTQVAYRITWEKELLPSLGSLRASEILKSDIYRILDRIESRGAPIQAKRARAHIHRLFNFAVERGYIQYNPCTLVKLDVKENPRERYLKEDEIAQFWTGLDATGINEMTKLALRLLLTTGQRKGEICKARWSDISWVDATWTIPKEVAKNRKEHIVHLSSLAMDLLRQLHTLTGLTEYLMPSPLDFEKSIRPNSIDQTLHKEFVKIGVKVKFRPHDLRRTFGTHLDRIGIKSAVISRILNHSLNRGVTGIYTQHDAVQEMKQAMESWARELCRILRLPPLSNSIDNVISLQSKSQSVTGPSNPVTSQGGK